VNSNPGQSTDNGTVDPYELEIPTGRELDLLGGEIS
jgi:hypothetical protein